jgi:hypothetical protein
VKPKSDNLFHFTKSLEVIKSILKNGIYPHFCLEDIGWLNWNVEKYLGFPMACFCDIPLSRISEHTDFYGKYGIGLTKVWGVRNKLNPVIYTPPDSQIRELMEHLYVQLSKEDNPDNEGVNAFKLWSLLKPTSGKVPFSDSNEEKEFLQECEWRYVPPINKLVLESGFEKDKEKNNKEIEEFKLKFEPADIRYIFVKEDNEIPDLVDFITENLGKYQSNDLKILQTRIVSLDTLKLDL